MKRILFIFISALMIFISSCATQRGAFRDIRGQESEMFYTDSGVYYDTDSSKSVIVLYIEIPVENLLYKMNYTNDKYEAKISATINITGTNDSDVVKKVYYEYSSFTEKDIKDNIKQSLYYVYKYYISPGKYKAGIKIKDENSENEFVKKYDLTVRDFSYKDITASDLLLLKKYSVNSDGTKEITPLIKNNISGLENPFIFYEIYNNTNEETAKQFILRMSDHNGKTLKQDTLSYILKPGRNREVESLILPEINLPLPGRDDFGFSDERNTSFLIELIDKTANQTVADKKLISTPPHQHPAMQRHPR